MKILHLLSTRQFSGAENVACQIINLFDGENDFEMVYCSPDGSIASALRARGVKFCPINKFSKKELKRIVLQEQPDVIHAHDYRAMVLATSIKKIKIVGQIHVSKISMSKVSLQSLFFRLFLHKIQQFIWVSDSCYNNFYFKKLVSNRSDVLYNVINYDRIKKLVKEDEKNYNYDIIYIGRLVYQKHPERLIDIVKQVKSYIPNIKMAVVGDGKLMEDCKKLAIKQDLSDNVDFKGFVKNPYKMLSQSKVFLLTSRFEGTPMVALESMSLGIPIVSTRADGMIDLINDGLGGRLYIKDEEAVEYIKEILIDGKRYKEDCIKSFEKKCNLNVYKKKLIEIYTNVTK